MVEKGQKKRFQKKLGIDENAGKEVEEDIVINEDDEAKSDEENASDKTDENKQVK